MEIAEKGIQPRQLKVKIIDQLQDADGVWYGDELMVGCLIFDEWSLNPFDKGDLTKGLHLVYPPGERFAGTSRTSPLFEPRIVEIRDGGFVFEGWDGIFYSVPGQDSNSPNYDMCKCGETPRRWIVFPVV